MSAAGAAKHIVNIEIIAELAQGFEGRVEQASLLVKAAAAAGADAAKLQLVYAEELGTPDYRHYELFRGLEMPDQSWQSLVDLARAKGIQLYVDVFGRRSLELADRLGITTVKLHGTDIANQGFLEQVARSRVPRLLLGAGGAHASELDRALEILSSKEVVVLLGFQTYPTPTETNQIARIGAVIRRSAGRSGRVIAGFADHASPTDPLRYALAAAAIGAGARVIEKHLTLGRNMQLEDHESALNPDEFGEFTEVVRGTAQAMGAVGDGDDFGMSDAEAGYRRAIRRHVVSSRALTKGTRLSPADLVLKRTAAEDFLTDPEMAYGRTLTRDVAADSAIGVADLEGR